MYTVGNFYVIAAAAVIGGGLFGFDISSMSAIIGMQPRGPHQTTEPIANHYRHAGIQMLLQRRRQHQRTARMFGSERRCYGWHYRCDDCRFLGWCFGLRLHFRYARQATVDHDWLRALDHWLDHYLRGSEYPDVDRRTYHQRSLRGRPVGAGSCVHQRVRAAYQARSSGWSSAVGYYMGYLDPVLVSVFPKSDCRDIAD